MKRGSVNQAVFISACIAVSMLLAGCAQSHSGGEPSMTTSASSAAGGQSLDQARGELEARSGLTEVSMKVNQTVSGLQTHRRLWVEATTDATDSGAQKEIVEYLLALGWSINDVDADKGISVRLHTNPQVVVGDLVKSSWSDLEYRSSPDSFKELVVVPRSALEEKLGAWPGPVPASN